MEHKIVLPQEVKDIIKRLENAGYNAYIVGGAVRDPLIGRAVGDHDITTSARPDEIKAVFNDVRTVDTGIKHGTVTVIPASTPYEITTYRIDGDYKDNRHPDGVIFTDSLGDDLCRRDFTVNAMAYNDESGLVDLYGGKEDIKLRLIRAVGDARVRFDEDGLRILRALRFAAVLDFDIESSTSLAIHEKRELLIGISRERVYSELKKLISGKGAHRILLEYSDVFKIVLDGLEITEMPSSESFESADNLTRLASLFLYNSADPAQKADEALTELKTDKHTRLYTVSVLTGYDKISHLDDVSLLLALKDMGEKTVGGIISLGILTGKFSEDGQVLLDTILKSGKPYKLSGLAISGSDLLSLGYRGEALGETLSSLLTSVIMNECENKKERLIAFLKEERK